MKEKDADAWYPFYIDKYIFGSTRLELEPDERSVWVDLLTLSKKDDGFVRANEGCPYLDAQLCGLFVVPLELLQRTVKKCVKTGKIKIMEDGTLYILSTEKYKLGRTTKWRHEKKHSSPPPQDSETHLFHPETDSLAPETNSFQKCSIEKRREEKSREENRRHIVEMAISYLNEKTGKKFSIKSDLTLRHMNARIAEGRTVEDFKRVIDVKVQA